jgi:hypothetical protein|nr:MAG TPA: hypothetical protein [Caudoviricetes sp.]
MGADSFEIKVVPSVSKEEQEMMTKPLDRLKDEFDGWVMYKTMYKNDTTEQRYRIASQQEFGHLLMALEDFVDCIQDHKPDEIEVEEFKRFIEHLSLKAV